MENKEKRKLAQVGENLAAQYLENLGYLIIRHNFHSAYGELDLITQDNLELVIVEVKTRTSHNIKAAENSISKAKQKKLTLTAMQFLADYPDFAKLSCRFDVIVVFH
ncbi:MAG: YraN family protein, partial [Candidatus Cloacimonadaceae bacterium]